MDMERIMPVTLWSTLGGGDEVDMLEDIDGARRGGDGGQLSTSQ